MKDKRSVSIILLEQAKEEFAQLNRIVGEQLSKGQTSSEEMQLLKSIKQKSELIRLNPIYGGIIFQKIRYLRH